MTYYLNEFEDYPLSDIEYDAIKENIALYYTNLGLIKNCSKSDIRKNYKELALKYHPDKGGDEDRMATIIESYKVLNDDNLRNDYDRKLTLAKNFIPHIRTIVMIYGIGSLVVKLGFYYGIGYTMNLFMPFSSIVYTIGVFTGKKLLLG